MVVDGIGYECSHRGQVTVPAGALDAHADFTKVQAKADKVEAKADDTKTEAPAAEEKGKVS